MSNYRIPSDYKNQTPRAIHRRASSAYGTIHPGLAIPVHHRHLNVGERIRGRIDELLQSQPMLGPLMNGFKLITIATFTPDSAIYGWMSNGRRFSAADWLKFGKVYFSLAGDNLADYKDPAFKNSRPVRRLTFGLDLNADQKKIYESWVSDKLNATGSSGQPTHIGRGGLWDWLGIAAGAVCPNLGKATTVQSPGVRGEIYPPSFQFNAAPFFAYFLSHYYYIANMQEDYMYFTRGVGEMQKVRPDGQQESLYRPFFSDVFSSINPNDFLNALDDVRNITRSGSGFDLFKAVSVTSAGSNSLAALACAGIQGYGGLLSVPYSPNLFGNIIKQGTSPAVEIEVVNALDSNIDTGFSIAVPELRLKTKIQNWMDRLFISGGRVGDVFRTLWGTKSSAPYVNKPDFLGVWQASINPSNVRAMANGSASGEDANLGQLAACVDRYCDFSGHSGNVIGGGDFANDRIIPDCVRAMAVGKTIGVRNPYSTRPYQHVLEPLFAYLEILERQYEDGAYAGYYNVGPDECDCVTTGELVTLFCDAWGDQADWENQHDGGPHEANFLKLDCSHIKHVFGWQPRWHIAEALEKTVEWSKAYLDGEDMLEVTDCQIREF